MNHPVWAGFEYKINIKLINCETLCDLKNVQIFLNLFLNRAISVSTNGVIAVIDVIYHLSFKQ